MIKVLLFDFYGVFIPDPYGLWLEKNNLKREGIFSELINQRDHNLITEFEFLNDLSRLVERHVTIEEINSQQIKVNNSLVELVQELKQKHKIGLLSNASPRLRQKLDNMKLTSLFDDIFISSEISHTKPEPEAFIFALQKMDTTPSEILFIDDNPINIEAASNLGILSLQFTTLEALRKELESLQVL